MQKYGPSSSCAYCILAEQANSNVLGMLTIHDLKNRVTKELLLAKTQCTRDDKRDDISSIDYALSLYLNWASNRIHFKGVILISAVIRHIFRLVRRGYKFRVTTSKLKLFRCGSQLQVNS